MRTDLSAYTDRESALLWLSRHLDGREDVDIKTMYHLNIFNNLFRKYDDKATRPKLQPAGQTPVGDNGGRLSPFYEGLYQGGRRNVQASALLRAVFGAVPQEPTAVLGNGYTLGQSIVGSWAARDGCWEDYADSAVRASGGIRELGENDLSGSEANVYFMPDGKSVEKVINISHYSSLRSLVERISIHNSVFPNAKMEVLGFGMKDGAEHCVDYSVIVRQPLVQGRRPTSDEIISLLKEKGYVNAWAKIAEAFKGEFDESITSIYGVFTDEGHQICLSDMHEQNAVFTKEGRVVFFDCDASFNDRPSTEGRYVRPEIEGSEQSVRAIDEILSRVVPSVVPAADYFALHPEAREVLVESPVARIGDDIVMRDPEDRTRLLLTGVESIATMLEGVTAYRDDDGNDIPIAPEDKEVLSEGGSVHGLAFNLYRGRLDTINQIKLMYRAGQTHPVSKDEIDAAYNLLLNVGESALSAERKDALLCAVASPSDPPQCGERLERVRSMLSGELDIRQERLAEQARLLSGKAAKVEKNINESGLLPGGPFKVESVSFSTPPFAGGKPLKNCPGWGNTGADWGHIDGLNLRDRFGKAWRIDGKDVDAKNNILAGDRRFNLLSGAVSVKLESHAPAREINEKETQEVSEKASFRPHR